MLQLPIDDKLAEQVSKHVAGRGGDLKAFVSLTIAERMAYEDDSALQAEISDAITTGLADVRAGRSGAGFDGGGASAAGGAKRKAKGEKRNSEGGGAGT